MIDIQEIIYNTQHYGSIFVTLSWEEVAIMGFHLLVFFFKK
jgi:hypothetical protein